MTLWHVGGVHALNGVCLKVEVPVPTSMLGKFETSFLLTYEVTLTLILSYNNPNAKSPDVDRSDG